MLSDDGESKTLMINKLHFGNTYLLNSQKITKKNKKTFEMQQKRGE